MNDEKLSALVESSLETLESEYGISRGLTSKTDAVLVMEGWNKILAFQTEFSEAIFGRWRILVALEQLLEENREDGDGAGASGGQQQQQQHQTLTVESLHNRACDQVEVGTDPLAKILGTRVVHGRQLLVAMLDTCVRTLCPHTQTVQREAYRPVSEVLKLSPSGFWGMKRFKPDDEGTPEEYFRIYARCGVLPTHWVAFCKAFLWACQTHSPYAEEPDLEDLEKPPMESAMAAFVSGVVAKGAIEGIQKLHQMFRTPVFQVALPRFWDRVTSNEKTKAVTFLGETFYRQLLTNHEEVLEFFKRTDMDTLALHFAVRKQCDRFFTRRALLLANWLLDEAVPVPSRFIYLFILSPANLGYHGKANQPDWHVRNLFPPYCRSSERDAPPHWHPDLDLPHHWRAALENDTAFLGGGG